MRFPSGTCIRFVRFLHRFKMQTAKHAAATAKEKVQNTSAKVEEKMDKKKASAEEKVQ